jgi:hypothetical protein
MAWWGSSWYPFDFLMHVIRIDIVALLPPPPGGYGSITYLFWFLKKSLSEAAPVRFNRVSRRMSERTPGAKFGP